MRRWIWRGTSTLLLLLLLWSVLAWAQPADRPPASVEERRLLHSLQEERARLEGEFRQKEEKLLLKEIELKTLAAEVDKKIEELKALREEIDRLEAPRREGERKRLKELSRIYEKMEPAQAAGLLERMEEDLAIRILSGMKPKTAGRLLDAMETGKAARLSAAYPDLTK